MRHRLEQRRNRHVGAVLWLAMDSYVAVCQSVVCKKRSKQQFLSAIHLRWTKLRHVELQPRLIEAQSVHERFERLLDPFSVWSAAGHPRAPLRLVELAAAHLANERLDALGG